MKRIVSLAAIVLTLTMALSLAACGEEPGTNENTENGQNQTSSNETGKTVDLAALRTQFVTDYSLTDVLEGLNNLYGITEDMVKNSASFSASSGAAFAQEVVMVEAVDESAAATVAEKLETRLSTIAEQAASYDPDSLALAEKCKVVTDGVYVGMFFSSHYDDMAAAFQSALS